LKQKNSFSFLKREIKEICFVEKKKNFLAILKIGKINLVVFNLSFHARAAGLI
jgi:hypothetical protein